MSQHPAGRYNSCAPFRRGPPAPLYLSTLTNPKRAIVFMAVFDVDAITSAIRTRLAAQIGVFHGLYRQTQQITALIPQQRRYATRPLLTSASDSPAMAEISGRLAPIRLERTLDVSEGGRFGALANSAVGVLTLNNADGGLDDFDSDVALAGRDVRISVAGLIRSETGVDTVEGGVGSFGPLFSGVVESLAWSRSQVQIKMRDARLQLERPVQRATYSGTGRSGGTPEMQGVTKPLAFGQCLGIRPVLVDPVLLIYQYHDGESLAVQSVYDGGLRLLQRPDVGSYDELSLLQAPGPDEPGDFPLGSWIGCPRGGYFRLAGPAAREVTADVYGSGGKGAPVEPFSDGTLFTDGTGWQSGTGKLFVRTAPAILLRILTDYGGLTEESVAEAHFRQMAQELPYDTGMYFAAGGSGSVLDAAWQLTESLGCILLRAKDGRYQLRRLAPPSQEGVAATIREDMIVAGSLERQSLPYRVPWTSWEVSYARNWTPLSDSELFPGVPPERRFVLTRESQIATIDNPQVALIYRERAPAQLSTLLLKEPDAREVGNRHAALYTHGRQLFELRVSGIAYRLELLDTVRLVARRFGLHQGSNFLVVHIDEDGDTSETRLRLFGGAANLSESVTYNDESVTWNTESVSWN